MEARTATKREREIIALMEGMEARGEPIEVGVLSRLVGCSHGGVSAHLVRIRKLGLMRWEVKRAPKSSSKMEQLILSTRERLVAAGEPVTCRRIARTCGISRDTASSHIHRMREAGRIDWQLDKGTPRRAPAGTPPKPTGIVGRTVAALEALEAEGTPITAASLGEKLGHSKHTARNYLLVARGAGFTRWNLVREAKRRPDPRPAPTLDDLSSADRKALDLAARIFEEQGEVCLRDVARQLGPIWHHGRVARLRALGFWTWPMPDQTRPASPAEIVAVLEESRKGLIDARMERDETAPGVVAMPIRQVARVETNREAVGKILRDWKLRTGRIKASPEAQRDRQHIVKHPMAPREARVYRFSTSHVHSSRYDG